MGLRKFFAGRENDEDLNKLHSSAILLTNKTNAYLQRKSFEEVNMHELFIFFAAFTIACYSIFRKNPSREIAGRFGTMNCEQITKFMVTNKKPSAPKEHVEAFFNITADTLEERINEYRELIIEELNKPKGVSAVAGLTCGILKRLYGRKDAEELYDPIFSMMILNHIVEFQEIFSKE